MNWEILLKAAKDTLLMTGISTLIAYVIGLPLGILLYITSKNGLGANKWMNLIVGPNKWINFILGTIVNIFRSIPCLLLIIVLIPLTNIVFGKGSWSGNWYSMIVPLVFASFAFIARMVEQSLSEVNSGVIEAAKSLGASNFQIITKVLLTEARPSLISGFAVTVVSIIGYTSFAGYIAGGGLIVEAFNLGYYGTDKLGMWICILFVVIIVQIIQEGGLLISKKIDKRRK
ncbi:MAG: ABC transporter permease [Bacilli bacterium]|nr:ABC transporter permease [Bacilli bacterium]